MIMWNFMILIMFEIMVFPYMIAYVKDLTLNMIINI